MKKVEPDLTKPETWEKDQVFFAPADPGEAQLADGFHEEGTLDGWLQAIASLDAYPRVQLLLYASLASPLLKIVGAPNFVVDTSYSTSSGKTTALRVAASVWGRPETSGGGVMWTWEATPVWIERTATVLNNFPLILDDTKLARRPADVARTLYMFASGAGRGRGSKSGIDITRHFQAILLSSGEAPITSFTQDGGTRARTLSLWGAPFEGPGSARTVAILNQELPRHYGQAAEPYIRHILDYDGKWDEIRQLYRKSHEKYLAWAADHPVAGRLAAYCAVIDTAAILVHEAIDMPWDYTDPIADLWSDLVSRSAEADRAEVALRIVIGWANAHQQEFFGRHRDDHEDNPLQPHAGWAGRWEVDNWEYIAIDPHRIKTILRAEDFSAADIESIIRLWRERNWIETESGKDGKPRHPRLRVAGALQRLVKIRREAIDDEA